MVVLTFGRTDRNYRTYTPRAPRGRPRRERRWRVKIAKRAPVRQLATENERALTHKHTHTRTQGHRPAYQLCR